MSKSIVALAVLTAFSGPALADQANIDRAIKEAVTAYKTGGETALTDRAKFCYDSIDFRTASRAPQVEYCYSFETASLVILKEKNEITATSYFSPSDLLVRAAYNLERARVVTLPEQFTPYIQKRLDYIMKKVPPML